MKIIRFIKPFILLLGIVIQMFFLYFLVTTLNTKYAYEIIQILSIIIILLIVSSNIKREYKISWIIFFSITPILAFIFYLLFGNRIYTNKIKKLERKIDKTNDKKLPQNEDLSNTIQNKNVSQQAKLLYNLSGYPIYTSKNIEYFTVGQTYFEDLIQKLKIAKKFIIFEYYILAHGKLYDTIKKILIQKAKQGVEIFIIYDKMGSSGRYSQKDEEILKQHGINIEAFNKKILNLYNFVNHRTHRKLTIIDGIYTYTGGLNIADEYINELLKYGYWKDMGVRFEGEGSLSFIKAFFRSWELITSNKIDISKYYIKDKDIKYNNSLVIPFTSEPTNYNAVAENSYMMMISNAKKYIYISTPYLIIDIEILTCLKLSAMSGVDVRIIVPGIPDKKLVYFATKAHFKELIDVGVKIYTYTPGFIHGKVILVDDLMSIVGSINFDYRSLVWNYECGVFIADKKIAQDIKKDFNQMFEKSKEHNQQNFKHQKLIEKLFNGLITVFEPLF